MSTTWFQGLLLSKRLRIHLGLRSKLRLLATYVEGETLTDRLGRSDLG